MSLYEMSYVNFHCEPRRGQAVIDSQQIARTRHKLHEKYKSNRLEDSSGHRHDRYLISGGVVEDSGRVRHGAIYLTHESKKGLESMAKALSLPKPSNAIKVPLDNLDELFNENGFRLISC